MGVFRQLGDPLAGAACLCQHHGVAYAETVPPDAPVATNINRIWIEDDAVIVQVAITTTETCCIVVNAAAISSDAIPPTSVEIERPVGTIRTQQEDHIDIGDMGLMHHASWEVLAPGTYTYYLVHRGGFATYFYGAWIKAIASDCEG